MPTTIEVMTQEDFDAIMTALNAVSGQVVIPDAVKPAVKAVLEWLASKLNGTITWS